MQPPSAHRRNEKPDEDRLPPRLVTVRRLVTTPYGSKPRANVLTPVCRPTPIVRFMHTRELALKTSDVSHGTMWNTGAFFPLALYQRTHRNTLLSSPCLQSLSFIHNLQTDKIGR